LQNTNTRKPEFRRPACFDATRHAAAMLATIAGHCSRSSSVADDRPEHWRGCILFFARQPVAGAFGLSDDRR
jgi:hypothetical protein